MNLLLPHPELSANKKHSTFESLPDPKVYESSRYRYLPDIYYLNLNRDPLSVFRTYGVRIMMKFMLIYGKNEDDGN
jgi:hypothetical protein